MSKIQGPIGRNFFSTSPKTPGPLGHNDDADPNMVNPLIGDTPGSLGIHDHADLTFLAGPVVMKNNAMNPDNGNEHWNRLIISTTIGSKGVHNG